ncbi:acetoacetate metabolism transcriptional regulator AtoC [Citrobacter freundii]|uniref:Acetoacetate metabolism transcriptional regulator AtoC n=1 Tax=Citrobacter meridianamericanus TaxID=2894201 RepID=A0ABT1B4A1_9ENTR|nr:MULTISPECIES: acetoacetate metabolism transcriptional regulator AtoC [Citrobacter]MBC6500285.1 acetoacetate metabolism transcriptional regulator AtoC [Citrobacter freundii]MBC6557176.1 acetoacetate metabolism transcriptional regulator AtoC [Citrobacter braakii]MBC6505151.1 acetoacetate metabolism transcriptional regulator AtoC [Citrobacter freundii]MBP8541375.1 acetoacetate metabolism transcriptional regulator AtoC [Citrobacter sp. On2M]MBW5271941.1 acetoacetate metabolism transcriptional r
MKTTYRILIVDDEENVRRMLATAFSLQGHETHDASDGKAALSLFSEIQPDVVLMDIRMPEMDGIDALKVMRTQQPRIPVILMTAYAEVETAVEALRSGAFDYVIKPFDLDELSMVIQRALQLQEMKQEIRNLHKALSTSWQWGHILTNSPRMMDICKDTAKIALSQANVLISGESGTGKELIARAIHYNSTRANGPFIKVNCAALPESLLESELFGHEKGAFTGAQTLRQGLFERAHQGTLLLDEIGEMPLVLQAKLLRILQEREFERIGGHQTIRVDIRIVAATNRCLQTMVKEGTFREDLFYRLNVIHLTLPPLRERREDIALLANHFLQKFSSENQRDIIEIDSTALSLLTAWPWPGNIRELSNVIERAVVMNTGAVIFADDLPDPFRNLVSATTETKPTYSGERNLKEEIKREEKRIILEVLDSQDGNRTRTALMLGISRRALMYKLQEYDIDPSGS